MAYISQNFGKFSQREVQRIYEGTNKRTDVALAFISAGFYVVKAKMYIQCVFLYIVRLKDINII